MKRSSSKLTLSIAQHLITSGRVTKQDLAIYCHALAYAGEEHWGLNCFTRLYPLHSIIEQTEKEGPLAGIPISVKANLAVREMALTASSKILSTDYPCGYDADVVRNLKDLGAIIIGITQMDEFGMGSLGTNLGEGERRVTKNPLPYLKPVVRDLNEWAKQIKTPYDEIVDQHSLPENEEIWYTGGSSSGSAASVAHGSSLLSLGSDTGGSIRLPAAWCGVTGFKPSYGVLSRKGLVSYASSLDTIGLLAPSAACVNSVFKMMRPLERQPVTDSTTTSFPREAVEVPSSLRVGIPCAFSVSECPESIRHAWTSAALALEQKGFTLVEIPTTMLSPELVRTSLAAYYVIASAEASSNLSRYDGLRYGFSTIDEGTVEAMTGLERQYGSTRGQGFGREVIRRILSGTSVLSSDRFHLHYEAAAKIRAVLSEQLRNALENVDVFLTPTCLSSPVKTDTDPTGMFMNDAFTVPISLACLPGISIPFKEGSPIGLQVVGKSDDLILKVAMDLQLGS